MRSAVSGRSRTAASVAGEMSLLITPGEIDNHDGYIGERYGVVTDGGREAMRLLKISDAGRAGLLVGSPAGPGMTGSADAL